ncbi:DUF2330 domain-containing protein [Polyangium spumosum]|uniref:DUF2330 domain-containing protein n=1 Tax=Polyangium spumosum TaxID=889282 RepID=A0A6N7PTB5_9BACT|nr:DUF2330 domain-containing protein [Polyangium spumosum]MRG92041.1 DUF2330 domain-containing protein [Polyangium spumosum]
MRSGFVVPVLAATLLASLSTTDEAAACGGCFVPPSQSTVVSAHRMALSISPKQTVLWDQIQYDGDPEEFAWVLPVKPGAVIEVSTDAWFDTLDAATTTQIFQAPVDCGNDSSGGFGCGAMDVRSAGATNEAGGGGGPSVTVVHRGTVGPYQTVTLSTDTPGALNDWLDNAGYAVDPSTQPVIDAYVAEKFDFIAIKLQPGKDVKSMKPVRIVMPGASPTLPLRMVAIGTGANVAVTLFMITEGRWEAKNFNNVVAPVDLLAWDFQTQSSNYGELRTKVLEQNGGASWLTAFAFEGGLLGQLPGLFTFGGPRTYSSTGTGLGGVTDTIAGAYVAQGLASGETMSGECSQNLVNLSKSSLMVSNPCPAGVPFDDPSCGSVAAGEIDARKLACGPLDDLAVALNGLHPKDVWLTRLEANLPRAALAEDLVLAPAASQETVDNMHQARIGTNVEAFCGDGSAAPITNGSKRGGGGSGPLVVGFGLGLAAIAAAARRRLGAARA